MQLKPNLKILLREGLLNDYFNPTISDDDKQHAIKYVGKNIVWYGDPEQMIVIHKDNVHGMWGNVYDQDKMGYLVDLISNHNERVEIECSYGMGGIIDLTDIVEEQSSYIQGDFQVDYENLKKPNSTGNEELDIYLGTEEMYEFEGVANYVENDEALEIFNQYKIYIALGKLSLEDLKNDLNQIGGSEEALKEFLKYEEMIKHAINNKTGDLGEFKVQLRDGHHRVMSAIESGEEYVCLNLVKDDIVTYEGHYQKVS